MKVAVIVSARINSKRLPGKALADIDGMPMVIHTCKRSALAKRVDVVYLATDSDEIKLVAEEYGVKVIMTSNLHTNSSERAAEACEQIDADIVVNVQGDEPLVYPNHIDEVLEPMFRDHSPDVTMGVTKFKRKNSPGDIKAVFDGQGKILYASRNDIPCFFDQEETHMWKMSFIVPFKKAILQKYLTWEATPLELIEDNHFLRIIENGVDIHAVVVDQAKISVDNTQDLEEVREEMKTDKIKNQYYQKEVTL
jgi:3-deoxy-manno-octulosonate cytidylyltransferase (CMP-KDO synthetase)